MLIACYIFNVKNFEFEDNFITKSMEQNSQAKTVLITGASSGIGRAAAVLFQQKGWNVVATMRSPEKEVELDKLPNVIVAKLDVTQFDTVKSVLEEAKAKFGAIDVVVNNAGFGVLGPIDGVEMTDIQNQINTNLLGAMNLTKEVIPYFKARKQGTIINVTSVIGLITAPFYTLYTTSKWGLEGFSESIWYEMRKANVRVKIIEPGPTYTRFGESSTKVGNTEQAEGYKHYYKNRFGWISEKIDKLIKATPEQVAGYIYKAATDQNWRLRYPTGLMPKVTLFLRKILPLPFYLWIVYKFAMK
ncbi:MAG: oxidoreductase [Candidatus Dojkabacteria bacterium]